MPGTSLKTIKLTSNLKQTKTFYEDKEYIQIIYNIFK